MNVGVVVIIFLLVLSFLGVPILLPWESVLW